MHIPEVKIRKLRSDAILPRYASRLAAGADLCACIDTEILLPPMGRMLVPTGLSIEIPEGFEAQIRPRSGLALKYGISLPNTPGTIDADYRGELGVIIINLGYEPFAIKNGDRIAQMVIAPVFMATFVEADTLSDSERGAGGFGSTGR